MQDETAVVHITQGRDSEIMYVCIVWYRGQAGIVSTAKESPEARLLCNASSSGRSMSLLGNLLPERAGKTRVTQKLKWLKGHNLASQ